jgi:hypothetical protein
MIYFSIINSLLYSFLIRCYGVEITAATAPGPRLLVRVSKTSIQTMNERREPYIVMGFGNSDR